jgi:hypothetical protein
MGCGCGKTSTPAQAFVYTSPQGKQTTYTSQVQAQAAVIRNGGGEWKAVPV